MLTDLEPAKLSKSPFPPTGVETTRQPFRWNGAYGYEFIPFTGLYHVGAREYDPRTARWLQRDPIDIGGGEPNLYLYAANDPLNWADPSGLDEPEWWKQAKAIGRELLKGKTWSEGLKTGLAAVGSAFTFGLWDGGAYKNQPGFGTSQALAGVGRDCLLTAATLGFGEAYAAGRGAQAAGTVARTGRGGAQAVRMGQAGERAAGITGPKTRIEVAPNKFRIPDEVREGISLTEVKNVKSLSFTRQLRDYYQYCQDKNLKFVLYTRKNTQLSKALQELIQQGKIELRFLP
ncbi:MAG: putative toxin [candidate division WOR-3 bacterium]